MHLKTLTIKGFKSFADPVTLEFEPGVTCIVGPNGSGKSNVVEAIGWVLGTQAPTALRSGRMDDVIFAGTARRPALGRAEVAITFDNTSGVLPVELAEVTISRTLFRDGTSEYAINRVPCRLLDITELLGEAGVGRSQHIIVGQGRIDAVLSARSTERRSVIEEAAGVLKHRRRRERAERRLEAAEADLARLSGIARELRRQLEPLRRQAADARRHRQLTEQAGALRLHLRGREIVAQRSRLAAATDAVAAARATIGRLRDELRSADTGVAAAEAELARLGVADLGALAARLDTVTERCRGLTARTAERREGLERERRALADTDLVSGLVTERDALAGELADLAARRAEVAAGLVAHQRELEAAVAAEEAHRDGAPPTASEIRARRDAAARHLASLERSLGTAVRRRDELAGTLRRVEGSAERLTRALEDTAAAEADLRERHREAVEAAEAAARAAAAAEARRDELVAAAAGAAATAAAAVARREALAQALAEARQRAGGELLAGLDGVVGLLTELIEVTPGWERAVAAALGSALDAVVCAGPEVARAALGRLAAAGARGTLIALADHLGGPAASPPPPAGGPHGDGPVPVAALVRAADPAVAAAVAVVCAGAVAVDGGWERALEVVAADPRLTVVTTAGDRFGPRGWRLGDGGTAVTAAALERAAEEERVALGRSEESRAAASRARDAARAAAEAAGEASRRVRDLERELADLRRRRDAVTAELTAAGERVRQLAGELERLDAEVAALTADRERVSSELAGLDRLVAEADDARSAWEARARELAAARAEAADRHRRAEREVAVTVERERSLRQRLRAVTERLSRHEAEAAAAVARLADIDRHLAALGVVDAAVGDLTAAAAAVRSRLEDLRRRQAAAAAAAGSRLDELRRHRAGLVRAVEEADARLRAAELEAAEARLRLDHLVDTVRSELGVGPEEAEAAPCPPGDDGEPAERLRRIEAELRQMGPVNPLAEAEHAELAERHEQLTAQMDDARRARRDLQRLIRDVNNEIASAFASAFAEVADTYADLFGTLFPGGTGRLRLEDPDDLLNTGVEIEARPPGKNVRSLSLLSGGERSLCALAFLFAVFRSRPSPFYVLDEVEAALDDVNLQRFLNLLSEFRSDAQIILVTHQKRTMEAADRLYGVSMEPGGSSRVVAEPGARLR